MDRQARIEHFARERGFIAALDQSGGSTPRALELYGISSDEYSGEGEMMDLIHEMRVRIVTSPDFARGKILGSILFERTMRSAVEGMAAADYLWQKRGILPFLKIDVGLAEEKDGISLMKPIPEMTARLEEAVGCNIFGTKMRSVVHQPLQAGVDAIVAQQFEFASRILDCGLIPIVEPEISISCPDKDSCEAMMEAALGRAIDSLPDGRDIALKLTLPDTPDRYAKLVAHPRVLRVTALSGGYDRGEACRRLEQNPGMIASFSRALAEGLKRSMSGEEFNAALGSNIRQILEASLT